MEQFLLALAPVVALVALGRVVAWRRMIPQDGWRGIERLTYVLIFPALVLRELANAPFETAPIALVLILIAALCLLSLTGVITDKLGLNSGPATGSIIQSNARWNTFVALAIAGPLMGPTGLALTAIAAAAMIPTANVLSVAALTRYGAREDGRAPNMLLDLAKNPIIIACVIGIGLNVTGLAPTGIADDILRLLAQSAIALGLLAAGAGVDLSALWRAGARTFSWSFVRLLGLPVIAVGLALAFRLPPEQVVVIAIATATPTATNGYVLARQLGGDAPLSANLIATQTVLAALTMPLVYWVTVMLLG